MLFFKKTIMNYNDKYKVNEVYIYSKINLDNGYLEYKSSIIIFNL